MELIFTFDFDGRQINGIWRGAKGQKVGVREGEEKGGEGEGRGESCKYQIAVRSGTAGVDLNSSEKRPVNKEQENIKQVKPKEPIRSSKKKKKKEKKSQFY